MSSAATERTTVRRKPDRGHYDRETILSILGESVLAHVGIVTADGTPVVIPMGYAVDGDSLLVHGSPASRLLRTSSPICVTVSILDGLVLARSLFNSSMNYRSVVVLGVPEVVEGDDKRAALLRLSEALLPGRVGHVREPSDKEVRATTVWRLPLTEASAKIRSGPPVDDAEDLTLGYWGGVIPLRTVAGAPEPDAYSAGTDLPDHVQAMARSVGRGR